MTQATQSERTRYWVCPECAHGAFHPFCCGGPHYVIKKNGEIGKRRTYRFVEAVEMRPVGAPGGS